MRPPKNKASVCSPALPPFLRPVLISVISDQLVPFQDSTKLEVGLPGEGKPPIFKAAVCVPTPAADILAEFKSFTSVQLVPSQVSV
jgi:hypothetical protein